MQDTGPMYGVYYSFGYHPECLPLRIALEGFLTWSNDISYRSAPTGSAKNEKYTTSELRLLGFYAWQLQNCWTLEGYSGLGARVLHNQGYDTVTTTGHSGYDRVSNYSYVPIGARFIKPIKLFQSDMVFIGHLEYDWFLSGTQDSYLDGHIENHQDSGYGARAGVDLYIPSCAPGYDYLVGAFIRHWNIKDSSVNVSSGGRFRGLEPRNTTTEIGIRFGLVF